VDHFLAQLGPEQTAIDLGCGRGSFRYASYKCRIIGIDVTLDSSQLFREGSRISYVHADSEQIPLASKSVDAVLSHHTMEHFTDYRRVLIEIDRVMKDKGILWIAVPNGFSLDDSLYRLVYSGGGHVNRFTRSSLINAVHELTRFRLKQEVDLFSSFVYLSAIHQMPSELKTTVVIGLNALTRITDKILGSRLSQYGWGFVFAGEDVTLPPIHTAYFNVCSNCGSGSASAVLRVKTFLGLGIFRCPNCGHKNSFVAPPEGLA
jgi:SAM-dependent methyltransferase